MGLSSKKEKKDKKRKNEDDTPAKKEESSKKSKKEPKVSPTQHQLPVLLSPIASPLADPSLEKKIFMLISKAAKSKQLRRGIKEVVKAVRKQQKGLCIIAGDVSPIDVIAHVPLLCEEASIEYCYVQRKTELGQSANTKRPTSVILILDKVDKDLQDDYKDCEKAIKAL